MNMPQSKQLNIRIWPQTMEQVDRIADLLTRDRAMPKRVSKAEVLHLAVTELAKRYPRTRK